jgi:hypothetical protein
VVEKVKKDGAGDTFTLEGWKKVVASSKTTVLKK